jgi:Tfp pilus assembly protein PilV
VVNIERRNITKLRGYILLEAVVTLFLLSVTVISFLELTTTIEKMNHETLKNLTFHQKTRENLEELEINHTANVKTDDVETSVIKNGETMMKVISTYKGQKLDVELLEK